MQDNLKQNINDHRNMFLAATLHAYKQIYIAPKSWKRIRGTGATGWLDSKSRLEEVWL